MRVKNYYLAYIPFALFVFTCALFGLTQKAHADEIVTDSVVYTATVDSTGPAVDNTVYYFGNSYQATPTASVVPQIWVNEDGVITSIFGDLFVLGTLGSSGTLGTTTISVNGITNYTISNSLTFHKRHNSWYNDTLYIPVVAGDFVTLSLVFLLFLLIQLR